MEVRGRMELRQGDARGILSAAFKVCLSLKSVFLLILMLSVAYELAIERYAAFTLTTADGKTTFQFAMDPQAPQNHSQPQPPPPRAPDDSFLAKLLRFSVSFPDSPPPQLPENQSPPAESPQIPEHPESPQSNPVAIPESSPVDEPDFPVENSKLETSSPPGAEGVESRVASESEKPAPEVDETRGEDEGFKLPALKIKYTGNGTGATESTDEFNTGIFSSRFQGRRGLDSNKTTDPSIALGVLLLALVLLVVLLALIFFLLCFNQSIVPAVLGYSAISIYMGKPVHLRRALASSLKVGLTSLMWLSLLFSLVMGAHSLISSRLLLGTADDVEDLLHRLSAMPFAFVSIFRDENILKLGIRKQVAIFLVGEYVFDTVCYALFIVACWVTIMERNVRGLRAFRRSWELLRALPGDAILFRVLESALVGRSFKFVVEKAVGSYGSLVVVEGVHLYMTVVWLVYYLAARSKLQPGFSYGDLEEFLNRVR